MTQIRSPHGAEAKQDERWLGGYRRYGGRMLGLSITMAGLSAGLTILQAWALARIIAGVVLQGSGVSDLATPILLFVGTILGRILSDMLRQGTAFEAGAQIRKALREAVLVRIASTGPVAMQARSSGEVAGILSEGVEAVQDYFAAYLPQKIIGAMVPLLVLAAVFPFDWVTGLILAICAPIVPIFMIVVGKGAEALNRRQWQRLLLMGAHLFDRLSGLVTLRQLGAAEREAALVAAMSEGYRSATMKVLRLAFLSSLVLEFFATIAVAMVAVYVGFRLYYGEIAFLPGLFALLIAPEFFRPLREMGQHYHARMTAIGAAEGLISIMQMPEAEARAGAALPAGAPQRISVQGLGYIHAGSEGLRDLSFDLARGETLAVMGPSGAGKTTMVRLLLGLLAPQQGQILLDGRPLSDFAAADWQARIGWLPQRPTLFAGTIAENIALGHPGASRYDLEEAARKAQAHDFIVALPRGYDTPLGESGAGLSGGQIRRVALARALVGDPALLILDEPTAALDRDMAGAVMTSVLRACPQAARLIVTHDADCAARADRVIRLERPEGEIA
ncbi:thiol reductant ABC exporter subunit CydD [Pseudooceanicola sp. CBS1P-1]|uniref:Thiol reductant ABC exporter subunit CydD n=1 Tax=Pseudooceanicola albus TaxID=2692189 RepID=A0A6L7G9Z8_9RHOB|nr:MULTISPECIES: thiol reductant ABC exporter subunit CydD [Pseudooceanicola]MBT9382860.1 thiol reductant ABC exporter subunit CydD [Pseudooceanicola endophyticus]MXN20216.1 thiol reductant ABC exporter subunit CydD [Pseudooceanicola albus]